MHENPTLRAVVYSMEVQSEHPLADAVVQHLQTSKVPISNFESITGKGIKAIFENEIYFIGNKKLLDENAISIDEKLHENTNKWLREAHTVIWVANSKQALAAFAISDAIKPTSKEAIYNLQKKGSGKKGERANIDSEVVYTVITRLELGKLQSEIEKIDSDAFMVTQSVKDIKGGMVKKRPLDH